MRRQNTAPHVFDTSGYNALTFTGTT